MSVLLPTTAVSQTTSTNSLATMTAASTQKRPADQEIILSRLRRRCVFHPARPYGSGSLAARPKPQLWWERSWRAC